MSKPEFRWRLRVFYEDTDAGGVVYYANYLKFMERARTEWLRSLGFEQAKLRDELGLLFAVRAVDVQYRSPARLDDVLEVTATMDKAGGASLVFVQQVRRENAVLCEGIVKIACLDEASFKPRPLPHMLQEALSKGTE